MNNDITLVRDSKNQYWRVVKEQDNVTDDSPRDDMNLGKMMCWHRRYSLGDEHEFKTPEAFLSDLLLKLAGKAPYNGKPVYDFILANKAGSIRFLNQKRKRVIAYAVDKTSQTEASVMRTEAALKELTKAVNAEMEKCKHPVFASTLFVCELVRVYEFSASAVINKAYSLYETQVPETEAREEFARWLCNDLRRRYAKYETIKCWEPDPDSAATTENGVYPKWFFERCVDELSVGEMLQILTGDALAKELVILPLNLYDHGGITMSTSDAYPYNDRWDAGQVGWIYATREDYAREMGVKPGPKWRDACTERLVSEVDLYDDYLTGNVYWVSVERFDCPDDDATDEEIAEMAKEDLHDGCYFVQEAALSGCYGSDDATNGIDDFVAETIGSEYSEVA